MLYVTIAEHHRPFISGVFEQHDAATSYLAEISEAERSRHVLHSYDALHFPAYVTEDSKGFRFVSEEAAREELARFMGPDHRDDEAWCYTNLYQLTAEFRPRVPGRDEMGLIRHHHITNRTLRLVEQDGFQALWSA